MEHLESNKVMNPSQHEIRPKRSTISHVLSLFENIFKLESRDMLMLST